MKGYHSLSAYCRDFPHYGKHSIDDVKRELADFLHHPRRLDGEKGEERPRSDSPPQRWRCMIFSSLQPAWVMFVVGPVCALSLLTLLAVVVHEVRYARRHSIKARMKRFAAEERAHRQTRNGGEGEGR